MKSEVCYAGSEYAKTLAYFNDEKGIEYLEMYLAYYLKKVDLYFDQYAVMQALVYLDQKNNTNKQARYLADWENYRKGKSDHLDDLNIASLEEGLEVVNKIQQLAHGNNL